MQTAAQPTSLDVLEQQPKETLWSSPFGPGILSGNPGNFFFCTTEQHMALGES